MFLFLFPITKWEHMIIWLIGEKICGVFYAYLNYIDVMLGFLSTFTTEHIMMKMVEKV